MGDGPRALTCDRDSQGQLTAKGIHGGYADWAVLKQECCPGSAARGAHEGAPFIAGSLIAVTEAAFDGAAEPAVMTRRPI